MPFSSLLSTIATVTTEVSLAATALAALSWALGSVLKAAPIPFRDIKEAGNDMLASAIRALFMLSVYSIIASLVSWIAVVLASAQ